MCFISKKMCKLPFLFLISYMTVNFSFASNISYIQKYMNQVIDSDEPIIDDIKSIKNCLNSKLEISADIYSGLVSLDTQRAENLYCEFLADVIADYRVYNRGDHTGGILCEFKLDKSVEKNFRKSELYRSYIYYIFDYIGEIRIGNDRDAIFYSSIIDGVNDLYGINRLQRYSYLSRNDTGKLDNYFLNPWNDISTKFLWISPLIRGWKLALSYSPDSNRMHFYDYKETINSKNVLSGVCSYERGATSGLNYKFLAGGKVGRHRKKDVRPLNSYLFGGGIGYKNISFEFNYINNKKSFTSLNDTLGDSGRIYKYKISCNFGDHVVYLGYVFRKKTNNLSKNNQISIKKVGFECCVNHLLTFLCEYRRVKTYTTTLEKLGSKHNVFAAEFKISHPNSF